MLLDGLSRRKQAFKSLRRKSDIFTRENENEDKLDETEPMITFSFPPSSSCIIFLTVPTFLLLFPMPPGSLLKAGDKVESIYSF